MLLEESTVIEQKDAELINKAICTARCLARSVITEEDEVKICRIVHSGAELIGAWTFLT
jgi:hypothetical protein